MQKIKILFALLLILSLFSCAWMEKEKLTGELKRLAGEINTTFVDLRESAVENGKFIADLYDNKNKYDLSIDKLDKKNGGIYEWFEDYIYYHKDENMGLCFIYVLTSNHDKFYKNKEKYLKELKLINYARDHFKSSVENMKYMNRLSFMSDISVYITYPYFDPVSALPKGVPGMFVFDWWNKALPNNNPDRKSVWSKDVFVHLGGSGWIMDLSMPVFNKNNDFIGIITRDCIIQDISKKLLKNNKNMILFLSPSLTILGASNLCKKEINIKELEDFYYLEQYKKNPKLSEEFKLTHESQPKDIRNLGNELLKGKNKFEIVINQKLYVVTVANIPEVNFKLISLLRK